MATKLKLTSEQEGLFKAIPSKLRQETALFFIRGGYDNQTKSYLNACKSLNKSPSKRPDVSASEILGYPEVVAFLDSVKVIAAENVNIDAEWVLRSAKQVFDRCMQSEKVIDKSGESVLDKDGRPIYKFEPSAANKSLEIIGKHVKVKAFESEIKKEPATGDIVINFVDAVAPSYD